MATFYPAIARTGGAAAGGLDAIDGSELSDGDVGMVGSGSEADFYVLDADNGGTPSLSRVYEPQHYVAILRIE